MFHYRKSERADSCEEANFLQDRVKTGVELFDGAGIVEIVIGDGDGATFFQLFDFVFVAFGNFLRSQRTFRALGDPLATKRFRGDDGNNGQLGRKFSTEYLLFCPTV